MRSHRFTSFRIDHPITYILKALVMDAPALLPFYLLLKLMTYTAWCALAVRMFGDRSGNLLLTSFSYGIVRFFLGFFFGAIIFLLSSFVFESVYNLPMRGIITYLLVYVPIRWIEWSLIAALIDRTPSFFLSFIFVKTKQQLLWRLGGIVVSFIADIPMIIILDGTLPTGRFMC